MCLVLNLIALLFMLFILAFLHAMLDPSAAPFLFPSLTCFFVCLVLVDCENGAFVLKPFLYYRGKSLLPDGISENTNKGYSSFHFYPSLIKNFTEVKQMFDTRDMEETVGL